MKLTKNKYIWSVILFFLAIRIILIINLNHDYLGGDGRAYHQAASNPQVFSIKNFFAPSEDYLYKIRHYDHREHSGQYPFLDINTQTFQEPGYIIFLSSLYQISHSRYFSSSVQYLLSFLLIFIWYKILSQFLAIKKPLWILILIGIHPFFLGQPLLLYTEILDCVLISLVFYFSLHKPNYFLGLFLGLLIITESFYLPLIILLPLFLIYQKWRPSKILLNTVLTMLIIAPVSIHYYLYTDGGVGIVSKNSFNLWLNNNAFPPSNYDQGEPGSQANQFLQNPENYPGARMPCHVSLKELTACESKNFTHFLLNSPLFFLQRSLEKWKNLWSPNLFSFNAGFNREAMNLGEFPAKVINNSFLIFNVIFHLIFIISFSLCSYLKNRLMLLIYGHLLYFHLIIAFGSGMIRYRFHIVPAMIAIIYLAITKKDQILPKFKETPHIFYVLVINLFILFSYVWIEKIPLIWKL